MYVLMYVAIAIYILVVVYVTGPENTCLICTKYIYSHYNTYLLLCVRYTKSDSLLNFLWIAEYNNVLL